MPANNTQTVGITISIPSGYSVLIANFNTNVNGITESVIAYSGSTITRTITNYTSNIINGTTQLLVIFIKNIVL